jgi:hypothetical protein
MRRFGFAWSGLLLLALAVHLVPVAGCGSGLPATGTQASPVNPEQAASQQKAYADFAKTKQPAAGRR